MGVRLIRHVIFYALAQGAQFMLLGSSPAPATNGHFLHLKHYLNDHPDVHLELQVRPELAHLVYAGSDLLVMPSMFEPCGLTQLAALKYGTADRARAAGWGTPSSTATTPVLLLSSATDTSLSTSTTRRSSPHWRARSASGTAIRKTSGI